LALPTGDAPAEAGATPPPDGSDDSETGEKAKDSGKKTKNYTVKLVKSLASTVRCMCAVGNTVWSADRMGAIEVRPSE